LRSAGAAADFARALMELSSVANLKIKAEIACGNFSGHHFVGRRQKAWFLPAAAARGPRGNFSGHHFRRPPAKSVVFAGCGSPGASGQFQPTPLRRLAARSAGQHEPGPYITIAMPVAASARAIAALNVTRPAGLASSPRRELPNSAHTAIQGRLIRAMMTTM
jgi:hypothetical protein